MTHVRLRFLGLAVLAVLGSMAFSAAAAQAADEFLLLNPGQTFAEEGILSETFGGELEKPGRFIVPELFFEITCPQGQVVEGTVYATLVHATIRYSECKVYEIGVEKEHKYPLGSELPCDIANNLQITTKVKGVPKLHKKETFVLFEPLEKGQPFTTIVFVKGTGCPLPLNTAVTGSVVGLPTQENVVNQLITFSPQITLLWQEPELPKDKLLYGVHEAYLEGSFFNLVLNGINFPGEPWGAH
jgi:hypothetical protein